MQYALSHLQTYEKNNNLFFLIESTAVDSANIFINILGVL